MTPQEMQSVMRRFREMFPNTPQGLNLREMVKILSGELLVVTVSNKKNVLMTPDELAKKLTRGGRKPKLYNGASV